MELLYFILGFTFASYLMPVFEGLGAWFLTWVEAKKIKQTEIVNQRTWCDITYHTAQGC